MVTIVPNLFSVIQESVGVQLGKITPSVISTVPGFLSAQDKILLASYAQKVMKNGIIVEIGSFLGLSSIIMSRMNRSSTIICIDPCDASGDKESRKAYAASTKGSILQQYTLMRLYQLLFCAHTSIRRTMSYEAMKEWDLPIDLLFVDGDHSYEAVLNDVEGFGRYVKPSGRMILHDSTEDGWPGPKQVADLLQSDDRWNFIEAFGSCTVFERK